MIRFNNPREMRALQILSSEGSVKRIQQNKWAVKSQTGEGEYVVRRHGLYWSCECPNYHEWKSDCKHIYAIKFSAVLANRVEGKEDTEPVADEHEAFTCPECNGTAIIKRGIRKTGRGKVQIYGCKDCGQRFTPDKGFNRMKHNPKAITLTMDLYFKGISYRKICDHLKQFYNLTVSQTTPMRWVKKYLKVLSGYVEEAPVEVGNVWHSDEMTIFKKKEGQERRFDWIWNVMDAKTRYLLACRVTEKRYVEDAVKPLRDARERAASRPDMIVTDGLLSYNQAIKQEFYDNKAPIPNPHLRLKDFESKPNNNIVERLNGTYRERMKVMRSLSTDDGAEEYVEGMRVYYNYLRPHQGLGGMTPAEATGLPKIEGDRWMKLIEEATKQMADV